VTLGGESSLPLDRLERDRARRGRTRNFLRCDIVPVAPTPGRDRVPHLVSVGPRGALSFSRGIYAMLREVDDAIRDCEHRWEIPTSWQGRVG